MVGGTALLEIIQPKSIKNWIDGKEHDPVGGEFFDKKSPDTGKVLYQVARSKEEDVRNAVNSARKAQEDWARRTVVSRGDIIREAALLIREHKKEFADIVAMETGKSVKDAAGETMGAFEMGMFLAGEGRRFYGSTNTSATPNKTAMTIRQPLGVAGLIIAANTPIANVAWKVFPALLCGNSAVLKAAEDTPYTALAFAKVMKEAGLPDGVLNVMQGYGEEAGDAVVVSEDVDVVSFTGSCAVGRIIQRKAGQRLAKVCMELGGKNPMIVCDDADLEDAVNAAVLSAFSNAGQRCAAGSRIIIFESVYNEFKNKMLKRTESLKLGPADSDDLGPVINEKQLENMLREVEKAKAEGAVVLTGGYRLSTSEHQDGYYMAPTIIENTTMSSLISQSELFGPITCLYKAADYKEAVSLANDSKFALTASIFTKNMHRAMSFLTDVKAGVGVVNGPTYGSEPHMPFGGLKQSGNGMREAGKEALDVYSDWKTIYINHDPEEV